MNENSTIAPLEALIKARGFDWINPEITDERFPMPNRVWNDLDGYKEFHFGENITSIEAVERMRAEGYEPANSHELLLWDGWNGEDAVIALGSFMDVHGNGPVPVLCLDRDWRSKRNLYLCYWDGVWNNSCHFLAVRRPYNARQPLVHDHYY